MAIPRNLANLANQLNTDGDVPKIEVGDSKVEVTDTGSDGTIKFFTDNVEKMKILPAGRLVLFGDSTTGGPYIGADGSGTSIITVAAGATVTLTGTDCGAVLVCVFDSATGRGGVFFGTFTNAVAKIAGDGEATDTGSTFAVYKSSSSHTMTFKNKDSVERPYFFGIYSAYAKI